MGSQVKYIDFIVKQMPKRVWLTKNPQKTLSNLGCVLNMRTESFIHTGKCIYSDPYPSRPMCVCIGMFVNLVE